MKKLLLLSLLLISVGGFAQQIQKMIPVERSVRMQASKETSANSIQLGYCGDWKSDLALVGPNADVWVAIGLPEETMKKYQGNRLTQIMIAIGLDTGIKNGKIFLSYALKDTPFYEQDVTFQQNDWNTISLTESYSIEGKEIYVGYKFTSGNSTTSMASPLAIDNGPALANVMGDYVALKGLSGKMEWRRLFEYFPDKQGNKNVMIKAVIEGNTLPQYDIALEYLMPVKNVVEKGEKTSVKGTIRNMGIQKITSFDLKYRMDDTDQELVKSFQDLDLSSSESYDFEISDLSFNTEGVTPVKVTVTSLNGNNNLESSNNTFTTGVACLGEATVPGKVLLENFTTAECSACPAGHTTLNGVLNGNKNVIWVAHHSGFKTDKFTIPSSEKYMWFFQFMTFAPGIMFDRINMSEFGAKYKYSPVFSVTKDVVEKSLKSRLETPAHVSVNISKNYNEENRDLVVTVSGNSVLNGLPGSPRLNVFLTEDGLVALQVSGGANYVHDHVIRDVLTDTWGDPVEFEGSGNYSKTYSYRVKEGWNIDKMKIIAFLSNFDPVNANNCGVHNVEQFALNGPNSIENTSSDSKARVFSENSQITIDGEYTSAVIYSTTGSIIEMLGSQQNSVKLASGIYLVKVINHSDVVVRRVVVK